MRIVAAIGSGRDEHGGVTSAAYRCCTAEIECKSGR